MITEIKLLVVLWLFFPELFLFVSGFLILLCKSYFMRLCNTFFLKNVLFFGLVIMHICVIFKVLFWYYIITSGNRICVHVKYNYRISLFLQVFILFLFRMLLTRFVKWSRDKQLESVEARYFLFLVFHCLLGLNISLFFYNNFMVIYFFIEYFLILSYLFCFVFMKKGYSPGLDFFFLNLVRGIIYLIGLAFIFSQWGFISLSLLQIIISIGLTGSQYYMTFLGLIFLCLSLFLKIGVLPFFIWQVKVYNKFSLPLYTILMTFPKIYYFVVLVVFLETIQMVDVDNAFMFFCLFLSLFMGLVGMLAEANIKKFFVYSSTFSLGVSISILMCSDLLRTMYRCFYFFRYTLLVFFLLLVFLDYEKNCGSLENLRDICKIDDLYVVWFVMLRFLLLVGVPPFYFFWRKYFSVETLISLNQYGLLVFFIIFNLFRSYGYLKWLKRLYTIKNVLKKNKLFKPWLVILFLFMVGIFSFLVMFSSGCEIEMFNGIQNSEF